MILLPRGPGVLCDVAGEPAPVVRWLTNPACAQDPLRARGSRPSRHDDPATVLRARVQHATFCCRRRSEAMLVLVLFCLVMQ